MKAYIFFSVHEEVFRRIAERLHDYVDSFGGFVWSMPQVRAISGHGIDYDPLVVFTRDLLPLCDDGKKPDLDWLARREQELGFSIQRMLTAERHLLVGRSFERIMRMVEVALREIAAVYDRSKPDFVLSEDISCFFSHVHFALARERKIPFWVIGSGRIRGRLSVYSSGMQHWERMVDRYREILARGLSDRERADAEQFVSEFRAKPVRPSGMGRRGKPVGIHLADVGTFKIAATRFFGDPDDPTSRSPIQVVQQRLRRLARVAIGNLRGVFEPPVAGEPYILYPIHYQPEASTLVQAPMYVDQLPLIHDIARSMPMGYRLYVKEHLTNRGRRPLEFYDQIRAIPAVRLLGPDEDTWALIQGASAIVVITGTMGWEGILFDKPVISFGDVFFNLLPHVYRALDVPKDGWYRLFKDAVTRHRPDRDAVLAMISAMQQCSFPGFMANAVAFPDVLEPDNIASMTKGVIDELALKPRATSRGA
jgi:hypothetical protein